MLKQSLQHKVWQCSEFCKCLKHVRGPITEHVLMYACGKMPGGFADIEWLCTCYVSRAVVPARSAEPPSIFSRMYTCEHMFSDRTSHIFKHLQNPEHCCLVHLIINFIMLI